MPSLKRELASLLKEKDDWFDRTFKRLHVEISTPNNPKKRRLNVESSKSSKKREKLVSGYDSDVVEISETQIPVSRATMEDKDYIAFLRMLKEKEDFYKKSGDYCLDIDGKDPVDNVGVVEDDVDPDYKIFLENTREEGSAYVFEMIKEDGTKVFLKYEEDEEDEEEEEEKLNEESEKDDEDQPCDSLSRERTMPKNFTVKNRSSAQKQDLTTPHWFLKGCKPGTISRADESYLKFLDHVWVKGDSLIFMCDGVIVKYEDDGAAEDSEVPGQNHIPVDEEIKPMPYLAEINEDDSDSVEILDDGSVKIYYEDKLRNKLKEILQKPFDKEELNKLLEAAETRKPLERTRITRKSDVSYPTDRISSSYLDLHPDLKIMLDGALHEPDQRRALALLRSLFFYYENVSHQGSFIPWKDPTDWLHNIICCCRDSLKCPMKTIHPTGKGDPECMESPKGYSSWCMSPRTS